MSKSKERELSHQSWSLASIPENSHGLKIHVVEVVGYFNSSLQGQAWGPYSSGHEMALVWKGNYYAYHETGKAASEFLKMAKKEFSSARVTRYNAPQKLADELARDRVWVEREAGRFTSGQYKPLPWANEDWFKATHDRINHFAHVSEKKDGLIAYTENGAKGAADIQTRMGPGRYLNNFFSNALGNLPQMPTGAMKADGYTPVMHTALEHWCSVFADMYGDSLSLNFAETEDGIVNVYHNGPGSCMKGQTAVKIYAAGDLQLAYLKDGTSITARCLVWPDKKVFGRPYGDVAGLLQRLKKLGYTGEGAGHELQGAKLQKIPHRVGYIMPYIDGACRVHHHPDGNHLAIGRDESMRGGGIQAGYQHGYSYDSSNIFMCQKCQTEKDGGEGSIRHLYMAEIAPAGSGMYSAEETWCVECAEGNFWQCHASGHNFHNGLPYIELADTDSNTGKPQRISLSYKHHYFQCPGDGKWRHLDRRATGGTYKDTGKYVSHAYVLSAGLVCKTHEGKGRWWPKDELPEPPHYLAHWATPTTSSRTDSLFYSDQELREIEGRTA